MLRIVGRKYPSTALMMGHYDGHCSGNVVVGVWERQCFVRLDVFVDETMVDTSWKQRPGQMIPTGNTDGDSLKRSTVLSIVTIASSSYY